MYYYSNSTKPQRPNPTQHKPLPAWDTDDPHYGVVHTVPPPELDLSKLDLKADFTGVTLDTNRWGGNPPFFLGANTTPVAMLMTPMTILYPRKWQDADLTEHAERNYTHYVISGDGWNLDTNGFHPTPDNIVQWSKYVMSWGFKIVYWRGQPLMDDPILQALVDNHAIAWSIPGGEVDGKINAEQYESILDNTLSIVSNGIPVGAHFTSNYPEGFPRDTFLTNWDKYDGRVHLMWQADQNDSAGKQGAMLYYARERVALGVIGGNGNLALNSRVYAYEVEAFDELDGQDNEEYGCLRSLELLYTTRNDNRIPAMAGFGNGARLPDGMWI